jgi:hypothetical protein
MLTTPVSHSLTVAETPVSYAGIMLDCFFSEKTSVRKFLPHVIAWKRHQFEVRKNLHHCNVLLNDIDATESLEKDMCPKTIQISRCRLVMRRKML